MEANKFYGGYWTKYNMQIKKVEVSDGLSPQKIGTYSFEDCENLIKIEIPSSVTVIGTRAFYNCEKLIKIEIPSSVTEIENGAFCNCKSLIKIEIPSSVTEIEENAFYNCEKLIEIEIPSGVTVIESNTFRGCTGLKKIILSPSVTTIRNYAFCGCIGLNEIILPPSVTKINVQVFSGCTGLKSIYILGKLDNLSFNYADTLGGADDKIVNVYYRNDEQLVPQYISMYSTYYKSCPYFELTFSDGSSKENEYTVEDNHVTYEATVGGLISRDASLTKDSFNVTGKASNNNENVPDDRIQFDYDPATNKITITVDSKNLAVGIYSFDVSVTGKAVDSTITDTVKEKMTLNVYRKKLSDSNVPVKENGQTKVWEISNAASILDIMIPAPTYGGSYDATGISVETSNSDSGFKDVVDLNNSKITSNVDGTYKLHLVTKNVSNTLKGTSGEVLFKIPVTGSSNVNLSKYNMVLTLKVKNSPNAVALDEIEKKADSITIKNTDSSCEYAIKKLGALEDYDYTLGKKNGNNIVFDNLESNIFYNVAVRYGKDGDVEATLPSETLVATLLQPPAEGEGYTIDYAKETITVISGYEIREKKNPEEAYLSNDYPIEPGKTYEVRKKEQSITNGDGTITKIDPSEPKEISIPQREDKPEPVASLSSDNIGTDYILIPDAKEDCEYIVVDASIAEADITKEMWNNAITTENSNGKVTKAYDKNKDLNDLAEKTKYNIYVRKKAEPENKKFASNYNKTSVTTKYTMSEPDISDIFNGYENSSGKIIVNAKYNDTVNYKYIVVPESMTQDEINKFTDEVWKKAISAQADGKLELTQYYDKTSGELKDLADGTGYKVVVRNYPTSSEEDLAVPSKIKSSDVTYTTYNTPSENDILNNSSDGISIDYKTEKVTLKGDIYEVYIPSDENYGKPDKRTTATLSAKNTDSEIKTVIDFDNADKRYIYVRRKAGASGNPPASDWLNVEIDGRDAAPKAVSVSDIVSKSDSELLIRNASADCEYVLVEEGQTPDWSTAKSPTVNNGNVSFSVSQGKSYKVYVRTKAVSDKPASKAACTEKTIKLQEEPSDDVLSGMTSNSKNTSSTVYAKGKTGYEYILVPKETDASEVTEEQWKLNGQKVTSSESGDGSKNLTFDRAYNATGESDKNITPGTEYEILVRRPGDDDKLPSASEKSDVTYTNQEKPALSDVLNNTENGISIDYGKETVTVNGETYEVYVPADGKTVPEHGTAATVSGNGKSGSITPVIDGDKNIYIRRKASADGLVPASDWLTIPVTGRPDTPVGVPAISRENVTADSIAIPNADKDCEYIIVKKTEPKTTPSEEQWKQNDVSLGQTGDTLTLDKDNTGSKLEKNTEYEVIIRKKAVSGDNGKNGVPASKPSEPTAVKTKDMQEAPSDDVLSGMTSNGKNTSSTVYVKGKTGYEYILVPKGTDASEVTEEQWKLNGQKVTSSESGDGSKDLTFDRAYNATGESDKNITPGTEYEILVRRPGDDEKMPSASKRSESTLINDHDFGEWEIVKKATCEESGLKKRTCKDCGYSETQEIPALGHDFDETNENARFVWKAVTDSNGKVSGYTAELYFVCKRDSSHVENIGEADVTSVVKDATEEAEGSITYTAVKRYNDKDYSAKGVSKLDRLVKLADSSQTNAQSGIYISVSRPDDAPVTKMEGIDLSLVKDLMSADELEAYNDVSTATDVTLYLEVQSLGNAISSDDKQKIQDKVDSLVEAAKGSATEDIKTGAQYLDLSIYKKIRTKKDGEAEQVVTSQITNTDKNIMVSVEIPQAVKAVESGYERTYHVIRVHGSDVSVLDTKQSGNTLSFNTDRFSSYAITYVDVKKKSSSGGTFAPVQPPKPVNTPVATNIPQPVNTPVATNVPKPTNTPYIEPTQAPTKEPEVTKAPEPTRAPEATKVPEPTKEPDVTKAPQPTESPDNDTTVSKAEKQKNALRLNAGLKVSQSGKKIVVSWGKVKGADGYKVYIQYCGSNFKKKVFTNIKSENTTKVSLSRINKKKIDQTKNYKVYVEAYKFVDGKKVSIGRTIYAHVSGLKNKKYTNVKKIILKKKSLKLKVGKTAKIKADMVLEDKKKKPLSNGHARKLRYASSDSKIAKVSKNGKIKAVKRGRCIVWVYARNGYAKKINVTVK